ncbi:uncharacterized protein LOC144106514 [Amblyomma americanum]
MSTAPAREGRRNAAARPDKTQKVKAGAAATGDKMKVAYSPPCTRSQKKRLLEQRTDQQPPPEPPRLRPMGDAGPSRFKGGKSAPRPKAATSAPPKKARRTKRKPASPPPGPISEEMKAAFSILHALFDAAADLDTTPPGSRAGSPPRFTRHGSPYPRSVPPPSDPGTSDDE